jgi:hypothetical protein
MWRIAAIGGKSVLVSACLGIDHPDTGGDIMGTAKENESLKMEFVRTRVKAGRFLF